jgi:ABC-type antimicrobial peptide transport system permease subunit
MKEIAIRRVVGAEASHIFQLLLKGYIVVFLVSAVLGCYAGYGLARLLMDMIFRINAGVSVSTLWVSSACVLVIVAITVSSRIWVALNTKATEVLKGD